MDAINNFNLKTGRAPHKQRISSYIIRVKFYMISHKRTDNATSQRHSISFEMTQFMFSISSNLFCYFIRLAGA